MFDADSKVYDPMTGLWTPARSHESQFQGRASAIDGNKIYYSDMMGFWKDERDCVSILSARGLSIIVDKESYLVTDKGKKKARKIAEGDRVATPRLLMTYNNRTATDTELTTFALEIIEAHVAPAEAYMLPQQQTRRLLTAIEPSLFGLPRDLAESIQRLYMRVGVPTEVRKSGPGYSVVLVNDPEGADKEVFWDEVIDVYEVGETEVWGTTVVRDHNLCVNGFFVSDA